LQEQKIISAVRRWLEGFVIELNLCPFAKRELVNNRIRFTVSKANTVERLLVDLQEELFLLDEHKEIETTLLMHPDVLQEFDDYNQFLDVADVLIDEQGFSGIYQIASFHPQYRFAETEDEAENYSNRSPYPVLHLLREESLAREIARYPGTSLIPERNIRLMREMGETKLRSILRQTIADS